MRPKHIIGDFEGFFERAKSFLSSPNVLTAAKCNFRVKKVDRNRCACSTLLLWARVGTTSIIFMGIQGPSLLSLREERTDY